MSQSAYIRFVQGSSVPSLTLDELKEKLLYYRDQFTQTAKQLDWQYELAGFPYTIETKPESQDKWFFLKGTNAKYRHIVFGVGERQEGDDVRYYIQLVLPDDSTEGDKNKGNEIGKFLARHLKAELQLFNGRVMYFNPRK